MNRLSEGGEAWLASLEVNRPSRWRRGIALAALSAAIFAGAAIADDDLSRAGNGPGPAANGPGPGCNIIPPEASIGTKVDISQFPPPDSLTDPELAGPVQLLRSGKFDLPIEQLAWVNLSKKLPNAGSAARPATRRSDGTFLFESGLVDFSPNRVVVAGGHGDRAFPPKQAQPGSVGDADYSPLVRVDGIVYDAPVVAAAVDDDDINFPNGNPDYQLVHHQAVAIDPAHRTVTLSLINGFSFGN